MAVKSKKPANPDLSWYLDKILEQVQQLPDRIVDPLSRLFIFGIGIVISIELFILATLIRLF